MYIYTQALEELSIEKQTMKERYDQALETAKTTSEERTKQMTQEHGARVSEMESEYKAQIEASTKLAAEELERLKQVGLQAREFTCRVQINKPWGPSIHDSKWSNYRFLKHVDPKPLKRTPDFGYLANLKCVMHKEALGFFRNGTENKGYGRQRRRGVGVKCNSFIF